MPINLIIRSPFDKDAYAFCSQTGATDRKAINDFVRGIKSLALWDSMVCWPMRLAQNFGAGTVVQSLGGLGSYTGELRTGSTSPVWESGGLDMDFIGAEMLTGLETPSFSLPQPLTFFMVSRAVTGNAHLFLKGANNVGASSYNGSDQNIYVNAGSQLLVGTSTQGNQFSLQCCLNGSSGFSSFNGSSSVSRNFGTTGIQNMLLGPDYSRWGGVQRGAFQSFFGVFSGEAPLLLDLYKETLGIGLSLP